MKELDSHKKYMTGYNKQRRREHLETTPGLLAHPATDARPNWEDFYTRLYESLGLESYLPSVMKELSPKRAS
jgi:hypothetical protein